MKTTRVSLILDPREREILKHDASRRGRSVSDYLRELAGLPLEIRGPRDAVRSTAREDRLDELASQRGLSARS